MKQQIIGNPRVRLIDERTGEILEQIDLGENIITTAGKSLFADCIQGLEGEYIRYLGVGTGTDAEAVDNDWSDTGIVEVERKEATKSQPSADTARFTASFTTSDPGTPASTAITECMLSGALNGNTNSSTEEDGDLCARKKFDVLTMSSGVTMEFRYDIQFS